MRKSTIRDGSTGFVDAGRELQLIEDALRRIRATAAVPDEAAEELMLNAARAAGRLQRHLRSIAYRIEWDIQADAKGAEVVSLRDAG